jgi:ankyrin repeat protein
MTIADDPFAGFVEAACVPLDSWHASGTLERAQAILSAHPDLATRNVHAASILGDEPAVRRFLELDAGSATAKGGPRSWDALTHLCFSRYLRLDRTRSDGFVRTARLLLDAGASANTGFYSDDHQPPEFESVLYGAAGVAHHPGVTRVLLERGADPNDGEVVYHTPETYDHAALKLLIGTGKLTADSLATLLLRKHDWHDRDGIKLLLEQGADANLMTRWGHSALHQALTRDNDLEIIELLLDHGADPSLPAHGRSATAVAAREGRGDVLALFARRGLPIGLEGLDRLLAACARNDSNQVRAVVANEPGLVEEVLQHAGKLLGEFAGVGNTEGVKRLLDLGADVGAVDEEGDGYWGVARKSTALHVAAWRARHATVKLLIERGAPVDAPDGQGRTPLMLAVRACVDSYWRDRRSPESVAALLAAGASIEKVPYPSGYAEVDDLLRQRARRQKA